MYYNLCSIYSTDVVSEQYKEYWGKLETRRDSKCRLDVFRMQRVEKKGSKKALLMILKFLKIHMPTIYT